MARTARRWIRHVRRAASIPTITPRRSSRWTSRRARCPLGSRDHRAAPRANHARIDGAREMRRLLGTCRNVALVIGLWGALPGGLFAQGASLSCPNSDEYPAPYTWTCVSTGAGNGCRYGVPMSWTGGCGCNGNSLFMRDCAEGFTDCEEDPSLGSCKGTCQYTYHRDYPLCVSVEPPPFPTCPKAVGSPVSITTGEMFFDHTDAVVAALTISRSFSTSRVADSSRYGSFGPGWNASFESRLAVVNPKLLAVRLKDGNPLYYFDDNLDGSYSLELPYSSDS